MDQNILVVKPQIRNDDATATKAAERIVRTYELIHPEHVGLFYVTPADSVHHACIRHKDLLVGKRALENELIAIAQMIGLGNRDTLLGSAAVLLTSGGEQC